MWRLRFVLRFAVGRSQSRQVVRSGLLQAARHDVRFHRWDSRAYVARAADGRVRRLCGHLRLWHPLLVPLRQPGELAAKPQGLRNQRHVVVKCEARPPTRTPLLLLRLLLEPHERRLARGALPASAAGRNRNPPANHSRRGPHEADGGRTHRRTVATPRGGAVNVQAPCDSRHAVVHFARNLRAHSWPETVTADFLLSILLRCRQEIRSVYRSTKPLCYLCGLWLQLSSWNCTLPYLSFPSCLKCLRHYFDAEEVFAFFLNQVPSFSIKMTRLTQRSFRADWLWAQKQGWSEIAAHATFVKNATQRQSRDVSWLIDDGVRVGLTHGTSSEFQWSFKKKKS